MASVLRDIFKNKTNYLLVLLPLAIIAELAHWGDVVVFLLSAAAVIPLAGLIGDATEVLAASTGPRIGGLLNATLGNAAELIITILAIRRGLLELVIASITGSILGNLLLVLGAAMLLGGLRNGQQSFDRRAASHNSLLLLLSVVALTIPSLFSHAIGPVGSIEVEALSLGVAGLMIVLYALGIVYTLRNITSPLSYPQKELEAVHHPRWSNRTAVIVLALSTLGVVFMSELLVAAVEGVVEIWGLSEFFLGIILIPIVGNVAEHLVAVETAIKNQMDLSVEIAISSSLQIALFVAPALVFISLIMGNPLTLVFNQFELIALIGGILITAMVSTDGESNWHEGAMLIALYLILGLAFFLLPAAL